MQPNFVVYINRHFMSNSLIDRVAFSMGVGPNEVAAVSAVAGLIQDISLPSRCELLPIPTRRRHERGQEVLG